MYVYNMRLKSFISYIVLSLIFLSFSSACFAEPQPKTDYLCSVYITGIGCHNCAQIDPLLFSVITTENPHFVVFDYEIYKQRNQNKFVKEEYFKSCLKEGDRSGVPFFILNKDACAIGSIGVASLLEQVKGFTANSCPMPDGTQVIFEDVDLSQVQGRVLIWTKNRVLVRKEGISENNEILHDLLSEENFRKILKGAYYKVVDPEPVAISGGEIIFENAIDIKGWRFYWNGDANVVSKTFLGFLADSIPLLILGIIFILLLVSLCKVVRTERGLKVKLRDIAKKKKDYIAVFVALLFLGLFFLVAHAISPKFLEEIGYNLPLPLFTIIIALIDGFNPCNMFVLTCLMTLLISSSDSKIRLYVVGFSFVFMVFIIYFLFMAAWLNIFKFVGFIAPLRIGIAVLALVAGFINCKELLFFKKGISLTIPDEQRGFLMRKIYAMKTMIQKGTFPILISSSLALATLASLVELPCTAGFPIIYTSVLSGRMLDISISYYCYLFLYNIVYVLPLATIITIFIFTFRGQPASQRQMEILKFVGGIIMILLGIVLLVNPGLIGLHVG